MRMMRLHVTHRRIRLAVRRSGPRACRNVQSRQALVFQHATRRIGPWINAVIALCVLREKTASAVHLGGRDAVRWSRHRRDRSRHPVMGSLRQELADRLRRLARKLCWSARQCCIRSRLRRANVRWLSAKRCAAAAVGRAGDRSQPRGGVTNLTLGREDGDGVGCRHPRRSCSGNIPALLLRVSSDVGGAGSKLSSHGANRIDVVPLPTISLRAPGFLLGVDLISHGLARPSSHFSPCGRAKRRKQ